MPKQQQQDIIQHLFDKYLVKIQDFKRHNCKELVPISELNGVASFCNLYSALATEENGVSCDAVGLQSLELKNKGVIMNTLVLNLN